MSEYKHWVVGLLFNSKAEVALVMKTHPDFQKGKLNGVGGKIEEGESVTQAMRREFKEEAAADIPEGEWREFALLKEKIGDVVFLVAHGDYEIQSLTDEQVGWYPVDSLKDYPIMADIAWLVPLALDESATYTTIDYDQKL